MSSPLSSKTRAYRKLHKRIGLIFLSFILLISISGFLLALKDPIQLKPKTSTSSDYIADLNELISLKEIHDISTQYALEVLGENPELDRIDFRPDKGIAKVLFKNHFTEIQIDCSTAQIISVSTRYDHIIEKIHDGSIIDYYINNTNVSKYLYTTLVTFSLIFMSISGLLLWYYPKKIKAKKKS